MLAGRGAILKPGAQISNAGTAGAQFMQKGVQCWSQPVRSATLGTPGLQRGATALPGCRNTGPPSGDPGPRRGGAGRISLTTYTISPGGGSASNTFGLYREMPSPWIWKRCIPLIIYLLISNNFSSMTFFCTMHIVRVIGRQIMHLYDSTRLENTPWAPYYFHMSLRWNFLSPLMRRDSDSTAVMRRNSMHTSYVSP